MGSNECVCCGYPIPEGYHICPSCEEIREKKREDKIVLKVSTNGSIKIPKWIMNGARKVEIHSLKPNSNTITLTKIY